MVNISTKVEARKRVREAQIKANEARAERERQNIEDTATLLVELGRLGGVDQWNRTGSLRFARRGSGAVTSIGRPLLRRLLGCRAAVKPSLQSPNWRG